MLKSYPAISKRHSTTLKSFSTMHKASLKVQTVWDKANKEYMKTMKIARIALKDDLKAQTPLMLTGNRKEPLSGWIEQTDAFYNNLVSNSALMSKISAFGYNVAKLNTEYAAVKSVKDANLAQDATKKKDAKIDELDTWIADFKGISKDALDEKSQWLEKLEYKT